MLRFLADESCDFAVVRALRSAGYDVFAVVIFHNESPLSVSGAALSHSS